MTESRSTDHRSHIQLEADLAGDLTKRGIKFEPTINLGHVLTFIGFLLAGFGAWSTLDKRVVILEENRKLQAAIDLAQDNRTAQSTDQITAALAKLDRQIERLTDKMDNARIVVANNSVYNFDRAIEVSGYLVPSITSNNVTAKTYGVYCGSIAGTVNGVVLVFPTGSQSLAHIADNVLVSKNAACIGVFLQLERNYSNDNVFVGTFAKRYQDTGVAALSTQSIRDADQQMQTSGTIVVGNRISGTAAFLTGATTKTISLVDGASNVLERWLGYVPTDYIVLTESPWAGTSVSVTNKSNTSFRLDLSAAAPSDGSVRYTIIHSLSFKP